MELLFESRTEIKAVTGKLVFEQSNPTVPPEPVLRPSEKCDGTGTSIYGSVLHDGGRYRMWYQAWPKDWDGSDVSFVGYAESEDGLVWKKPKLGVFDHDGKDSSLCDLGFHSPSVFIDPHAPEGSRYRATGYARAGGFGVSPRVIQSGYYTAHSSDGLKWELDSETPRWPYADVITSIYHPGQDRGIVSLKRNPRANGIPRRSIWNAELAGDAWSEEHSALLPDEFDDVCAATRGFASGDYYGMGMMPAGSGTVGFLWQFRHSLPRTASRESGVFGVVDVSLTYQERRGDRWIHSPGRRDFLAHGVTDWATGCIYTSSCPVDVGDEQWLYFCGEPYTHGWYLDSQWQRLEKRRLQMIEEGFFFIGVAKWKKDRLFSFRSDPAGAIELELTATTDNPRLGLNYRTDSVGSVRVELPDREGYSSEDCAPLVGDDLAGFVRWKTGDRLPVAAGEGVRIRLHLDRASVYAYELTQ